MPQQILPLIPRGATQINGLVSVYRDGTNWTYFLSTYPIYSHQENDRRMFRMVTAQLVDSGACRQIDIQNTFGVSKSSVIRSVNKLRSDGAEAFFLQRQGRRGGNQPVKHLATGQVEITSQNHGFAVASDSLDPQDVSLTHINLNDGTVEGFRHRKLPLMAVQYHPEAAPGPHDAGYFFETFRQTLYEFNHIGDRS